MKIQVREIMRAAKRHKIKMARGSFNTCALGVLRAQYNVSSDEDLAVKAGVKLSRLKNLEAGFEEWDLLCDPNNRYFKIGQKVALAAGLKPIVR